MKELLLFVCAFIAHVNSQQCGCGCTLPPTPCRPLARPLPPCPPPLPVCPPPPPPCPPPLSLCSRPLPAPVPVCPRLLPPCPRPVAYECSPIVEYIDVPVSIQSPVVTYEVAPCATVLPTCNCPSQPTLPVSAQILPSIGCPAIPSLPLVNTGLSISPCLGGFADIGALSPLGLINPLLPAASPMSALASTVSSLYPPINPCNCGCKYLRKCPMPPPFI